MLTEIHNRKTERGKTHAESRRKRNTFLRFPISAFRFHWPLLLGFALLPAFGPAGCARSTPSAESSTESDRPTTIEVTPVGDNSPPNVKPEEQLAPPPGESYTAVVAPKPPLAADKPADVAELKRLGFTYDTDANGHVTEINFNKRKVTPQSLKLVAKFPSLEILILDKTGLTNDQLGRLTGLRNLKQISLEEDPINDAGLVHLKEMPGLTNLSLSKTKVTGRGLKHIKGLTKLKTLNLAHCPVADDSLANLTGMTDMITLTLQNCGVTGPGLKYVGKLTKLITLNLDDSKIVGQSLLHLKPCQKLRIIYMRNSTVSKRSIRRLEEEIESIAIFTDD